MKRLVKPSSALSMMQNMKQNMKQNAPSNTMSDGAL